MSWRGLKNDHSNVPGFVGFYLLRRDADKADDGVNYISTSVWRNRESFDSWKASENSIKDNDKSFSHCPKCNSVSNLDSMLESPSKIAYYEGKLTIYGEMSESQMVQNTDVQTKTINQYV
jgi:heme-degrading monooxygenase HmoA